MLESHLKISRNEDLTRTSSILFTKKCGIILLCDKFSSLQFLVTLISTLLECESIADVIWKDFDIPLPGMKNRDITMVRMWVPEFLSEDGSSGNEHCLNLQTLPCFL